VKTSKITIARLFNLGSYEHVRYEITVDLEAKDSAEKALIRLEQIMEALKPESKACVSTEGELEREKRRVDEMIQELIKNGEDAFRQRHGHYEGTALEYIARCQKCYQENLLKRTYYEDRAKQARAALDNLGGDSKWKDAKLDWQNDQSDY